MVSKEKLARKYLTPRIAGLIKIAIAFPRFKRQLQIARKKYWENKQFYNQNVLFVAGLPKSGTTWLEKMLYTLPGFSEIMLPEAVYYEQKTGGSHDYDIPEDSISRLSKSLAVLKLHVHGSSINRSVLRNSGVNYVVIFRDLRDVAVSYFFYVRNTPWHPEYKVYSKFDTTQEGLVYFGKTLLPEYASWVDSWRSEKDEHCLIIKYEELRADTFNWFKKILSHYRIAMSDDQIRHIVNQNSFASLSKGRSSGETNEGSFFRKGISGDWKNHFNEEITNLYKEVIGDFLVSEGYEKDLSW